MQAARPSARRPADSRAAAQNNPGPLPCIGAAAPRAAPRRAPLPPPASVAAPAADRIITVSPRPGGGRSLSFSISTARPAARPAPPSYPEALRASIRHDTIAAAQLLELAAARGTAAPAAGPALLQQSGACCEPHVLDGPVEALLRRWHHEARSQPPEFNREHRAALPGLAEAAVVTRGGRSRGQWKRANQDAFVAEAVGGPSPALLLGVFDGHGHGGENASQTAAGGLAGAVPALRSRLAANAAAGSGSSRPPVAQQALVKAFQAVAASMRFDADFQGCGAAGVACLVERDSITAAWAGDCRAVLGLSVTTPAGCPDVLVHALTRDHKPNSPLERRRIEATGKGRVMRLKAGQHYRLCGAANQSTLSLSRAFGDAWAVPLGLTAEPDAVTVTLPPPASQLAAHANAAASPLDSLVTGSFSADADDCPAAGPARHVLVLGCDGLWDMVGNADAVRLAMSCQTAEEAANALLHAAQRKWASTYGDFVDDISVCVAFLPS